MEQRGVSKMTGDRAQREEESRGNMPIKGTALGLSLSAGQDGFFPEGSATAGVHSPPT